jgi:hypothetical protein
MSGIHGNRRAAWRPRGNGKDCLPPPAALLTKLAPPVQF